MDIYKIQCSVVIPFLDHLINELSTSMLNRWLLPYRLTQNSCIQDIDRALAFYSDDLSNENLVDEEFE